MSEGQRRNHVKETRNRDVAQLVAHYVRDVGVGRSSRLIPTKKKVTVRAAVTLFFRYAYTGFEKKKELRIRNSLILSAPLEAELLNLWEDFKKVVQFIDENAVWLKPLMSVCERIGR